MEKDILSRLEVARMVALQRLGILSEAKEQRLSAWVERSERNRAFYEQLYNKPLNGNSNPPSVEEGWTSFKKKYDIGKRESRSHHGMIYRIAASAAVLLFAITGSYYYFSRSTEESIIAPQPVSAVQLVLENGNKITLDDQPSSILALNKNAKLHAGKQEIDYAATEKEHAPIEEVYHTIIVPKYGEYTVRLSDNTTIKLNSESTLTFPIQFNGQERKIRLTGEAYLEVTRDTTRHFIVEAAGATITVLGTTFNVKAPGTDSEVQTTLVNGKVEVGNGITTRIIRPGEQAITLPGNAEIEVKRVDTNVVTAWVRDMFYFDEQPLEQIMEELSRWYEFKVVFENGNARKRRFTIEISRYDSIDKVLELIEETRVVSCRKEEKTIYIK